MESLKDEGTSPQDIKWHCSECQEEILVNIYEDQSGTSMMFAEITCPQGHVSETINAYGVDSTLLRLRRDNKIY